MLQAIVAFLQALPELIKMINSWGATIQKMKKDGMWKEIEDATDAASNAKTPAERVAAARKLVSIVGRIGS
jgi:methionine synthase I (cobalamin-dependent)